MLIIPWEVRRTAKVATRKIGGIRPHGTLKIVDSRGYTYLPKNVQDELGITNMGKDNEVPFVLDANVVVLLRRGATADDVLKGLEILKEDLKLRETKKR
jgi:hypothetical protein